MEKKSSIPDLIAALLELDPMLLPHRRDLVRRLERTEDVRRELISRYGSLYASAGVHLKRDLVPKGDGWEITEWAPGAEKIFLVGDFSGWRDVNDFSFTRDGDEWKLYVPPGVLSHLSLYRLRVHWPGGCGDRIPSCARRVVQDWETGIFNAQVWAPEGEYVWQNNDPLPDMDSGLMVYEAHVGMAVEEARVGSFLEFARQMIPRIKRAGYNAIQLMAVQEHPYYGSFGYHVSSFFAVSSRFGTPEEFKCLVDMAHGEGLRVLIDMVHSHAVKNEVEGLSRFDGSHDLYFHSGDRGEHSLWDSRCFDYGKMHVVRFLLSSLRFFLEEYRVDGFRFDGVTSMLFTHHGIGRDFMSYDDYFGGFQDEDAGAYLAIANELVHGIREDAITVAEDSSGMPELATPICYGGYGFDYRYAMGVADHWIKIIKEVPDEDWDLGWLFYELSNRRHHEKSISYAESHDQALVGDKTIIFRLMDAEMYTSMKKSDSSVVVDRGIALHKMIRLVTMATSGDGYLNFMGNEFGHPEWIDFPRVENRWSYHYARRQWSLKENPELKYHFLSDFDRAMVSAAKRYRLHENKKLSFVHVNGSDRVMAFARGRLVFVFNFSPQVSHENYWIEAPPGMYRVLLHTDSPEFGGFGNISSDVIHFTLFRKTQRGTSNKLSLYLPARTGMVLLREE